MKLKHFDRAIEILFVAMLFFIPIIFDRRIGIVFSGTKSAFLRVFIILIALLFVLKQLLGGKHIFKRSLLDWPVLAYLFIIVAATINSVNPIISFWGFYGRYEGLTTWLCLGIMFFIVTNFFSGTKKTKLISAAVMPVATVMAIYGIIQRYERDPYAWGGVVTKDRVIATIGQPNFLAAYVIMAFFLSLFFLLENNKREENSKPLPADKQTKKAGKSIISANWFLDLLPLLYFILVPLIFAATIFSQNGIDIVVWYLCFFLMTACSCLFAFTYERLPKVVLDALIVCSLGLSYLVLYYTQSRGAYIGFAVAGVLFIMLVPKKLLFANWKKLGIIALIIGFVTLFAGGGSPFARYSAEIKIDKIEQPASTNPQTKAITKKETKTNIELSGAAGSRIETWKSAAGIIVDHPVFGIGPEVLKMIFPRYETNLFRFKEAFHVKQDRCHNETFDVPVTKGLVGFFVYLIILGSIFGLGFKKCAKLDDSSKIVTASLLSAMVAYLFQNQFSFGVIAITSLFWVVWGMVMSVGSPSSHEAADDNRDLSWDAVPWIPVALVTAIVVFMIFVSFQQFMADLHFKTGKSYTDMGNLAPSLMEFDRSLQIFPYEGGTITNYGISLLNESQREQGDARNKMVDQAISVFDFGMKVDPYNADNFYITSRIYLMKNDLKRTIELAQKTLKIDPYYAEAHLSLADAYTRMGKADEAQKEYDETYRINPNLTEPKIRTGWKMIESNRLDQAFQLFQDMLSTDPRNVDVHDALGAIYLKRGDRARAKEEFEQALAFDPNNQYAHKMLQWLK